MQAAIKFFNKIISAILLANLLPVQKATDAAGTRSI